MSTESMESDMATGNSGNIPDDTSGKDHVNIPIIQDKLTFEGREEQRIKTLGKRMNDMKQKKRVWERKIEWMRNDFLKLYPRDTNRESEDILNDHMVMRRDGSTDVLDIRHMTSVFLDYPHSKWEFMLYFDCTEFDLNSIRVATDSTRIVVQATKAEESESGQKCQREYVRKVQRPKMVDTDKIKSLLTCDGVLVIHASVPPRSVPLGVQVLADQQSLCPPPTPTEPNVQPIKFDAPTFTDAENGMRRMMILVNIGTVYNAKDIIVQVVNDSHIQVKAKRHEKTEERFSKNKYMKDYELSEKIEVLTLRGGLLGDGKLLVGAVVKGHLNDMSTEDAGEWVKGELSNDYLGCVWESTADLKSATPELPDDSSSLHGDL